MMNDDSIRTALGIYGAGLSSFIFVRDILRRRARAQVRAGYEFVGERDKGASPFVLRVEIANVGAEPIFLETCGIDALGSARLTGGYLREHGVPLYELKPGQSTTVAYDPSSVHALAGSQPRKLIQPFFVDQTGRWYRAPLARAVLPYQTEDGHWSLQHNARHATRMDRVRALIARKPGLPMAIK